MYELLNSCPQLAYILDKNGNFIFGNDSAKEFFINGIDITDKNKIIKLDIKTIKQNLPEETNSLCHNGQEIKLEKQLPGTNGEKYWYTFNKTPLKNKNGEVYAIVTYAKNIDTEKRIQEQRETYIATLSHDLKTPAIAQVRALELLLSGQLGNFNDDQKELLTLTLDSCNYMYDMVYTLLSTCKFESGEIALNFTSFDIVNLVQKCIDKISSLTKENSTTINFFPFMQHYNINADRTELKRVIISFLSHSINFAYPNSTINVKLAHINNSIELRITNSGNNIEKETMHKLFRKYATHSEKFNKVGIGLGLYLSKQIIDAHNGTIIAESSPDQTNTFGFLIPAHAQVENCLEKHTLKVS